MTDQARKEPARLKDRMESLSTEMIDRGIFFSEAVSQFEKGFILEVLRRNNGNILRTAGELGIHRNTLSKRLAHYNTAGR